MYEGMGVEGLKVGSVQKEGRVQKSPNLPDILIYIGKVSVITY